MSETTGLQVFIDTTRKQLLNLFAQVSVMNGRLTQAEAAITSMQQPVPPAVVPTPAGGLITHGVAFTVMGSGFGTKPAQTQTVWDACNHGQALSARWDGGWPSANATYNMDYRVAQRSVPMPHTRTTKYMCGAHYGSGGANAGYNVMAWKNRTISSYPSYSYWSFYRRADDGWTFGLGSPADDNLKEFDFSTGTSPYDPANWYLAYDGGPPNTSSVFAWILNDDAGTSIQSPDTNNHRSTYWSYPTVASDLPTASFLNPFRGAWDKVQIEIKLNSSTEGYIYLWENGGVPKIHYVGRTDNYPGSARAEGFGGYARSRSANNWRYYADIFYDQSPTRMVLTNNATYDSATIIEPQPYTAWADGSVSLTCNGGALTSGTVHLHYRGGVNGVNQYLGAYTLSSVL